MTVRKTKITEAGFRFGMLRSPLFLVGFTIYIFCQSALAQTNASTASSKADAPSAEEVNKNWPGFRGPGGLGKAFQNKVPLTWSGASGENILWKAEIPKSGFSSPVVWDRRIFLTGSDDENQFVYCFDTETDEMFWQAQVNDVPGSPAKRPHAEETGLAAPTMTIDGRHAAAMFASGDLVCFDFEGNRLWAKNLGAPDNHYGHSSSLISYRDLLLVQYDHHESQRLLAFRFDTGELVYDTDREMQISWASPILIENDGRAEVILSSNPFLASYDPRTGKELWRADCMDGEVGPSPAYAAGRVFAVNDHARLSAIKIGDPATILWEDDRDLSQVSSPVATEEFVFVPTSFGAMSCFDAESGERYWVHDFKDGFYASPILVGELVYALDYKGVMQVFRAAKTFEQVSRAELGEEAYATPAFVHNRIYIRGAKSLYCVGE